MIPIQGQHHSSNTKSHKYHAEDVVKPQSSPSPTPSPAVEKIGLAQQQAPQNQSTSTGNNAKVYFYRLIAAENLPNLVLCGVGLAGVVVGLRSLKNIRKQTNAMEGQSEAMQGQLTAMQGQFKVMEGQLALAARQWVDVKEWTAVLKKREKKTGELIIGFDIFNPTRLPLTLQMVETRSADKAVAYEGRISLIPNSAYRFHATFPLLEDKAQEFEQTNGLTIPIQIAVWFTNEMRMAQEQYFGGALLYCDDLTGEHVHFYPQAEMIATSSQNDYEENAQGQIRN
jgi:hypothetical protein